MSSNPSQQVSVYSKYFYIRFCKYHIISAFDPLAALNASDSSFTAYDDIRSKLIAGGIPPEQIAFIHDANTETRKKELFAKVRTGQVRVLMGSTFKMGFWQNEPENH